jgi:integrase
MRTNPMTDGRIPVSGKKKRPRAILSVEQAAALFAVCPLSRIGTYVATLLWAGLRPGEAAGLLWEDVNLTRRTLHIRRALVRLKPTAEQRGSGTSWELSTTKTGTERFVPIPDVLVAMLRRHRAEQVETRLAAGSEYETHDLVFASAFGKPYQSIRWAVTTSSRCCGVRHCISLGLSR